MQGTPYTNYGLHSTPPPQTACLGPIIQVLPQTGGEAVCNFTFPKSLRNLSNSAKGSDHCHSSDYMKQQWETERYAAAHRDRISHRNPIITSDCNLRTLYQSGNSHQLSMTAQDLLHYASTETANMDEKEKILQPAQRPYIRQHQVSRHSSCWRTAQHKNRPRQSQRSFKSSGPPPTTRHYQQQRIETFQL